MAHYMVNGQRIYARKEGPPNGQVALLLHGWSSSWYALSPLLPLLSKRFSSIAVDLPGYGNSPRLAKRTTISEYADLLAQLINDITDNPVVLVGHSMGGMIAITLALRHPVLVERMVLLCPTISGHLSTYINLFVSPFVILERFSVADRIMGALEPYLLTITDRLMRPALFAERTAITEEAYQRLRADARRPGEGKIRAECYRAMREGDLRGKLNQIEAPTLVLWGAEDNTVPLRDAGVIADEWPNVDIRIIPKAGHWPHFETPDITRRYLASFLGLPTITSQLDDGSTHAMMASQVAHFLSHSDVGNGLNLAQRTRLAAQCDLRLFRPNETIAHVQEIGTELFIVKDGTVEVWIDPMITSQQIREPERLATLIAGQITGELALLDGGRRSASLRAGSEGATVLALARDRVLALCDDDPSLGTRLIWNIATALALRLRLMNWRIYREEHTNGNDPTPTRESEPPQRVETKAPQEKTT